MPGPGQPHAAQVEVEIEARLRHPARRRDPERRRHDALAQPRDEARRAVDAPPQPFPVGDRVEERDRDDRRAQDRVLLDVPHERVFVAHVVRETRRFRHWPYSRDVVEYPTVPRSGPPGDPVQIDLSSAMSNTTVTSTLSCCEPASTGTAGRGRRAARRAASKYCGCGSVVPVSSMVRIAPSFTPAAAASCLPCASASLIASARALRDERARVVDRERHALQANVLADGQRGGVDDLARLREVAQLGGDGVRRGVAGDVEVLVEVRRHVQVDGLDVLRRDALAPSAR